MEILDSCLLHNSLFWVNAPVAKLAILFILN